MTKPERLKRRANTLVVDRAAGTVANTLTGVVYRVHPLAAHQLAGLRDGSLSPLDFGCLPLGHTACALAWLQPHQLADVRAPGDCTAHHPADAAGWLLSAPQTALDDFATATVQRRDVAEPAKALAAAHNRAVAAWVYRAALDRARGVQKP